MFIVSYIYGIFLDNKQVVG